MKITIYQIPMMMILNMVLKAEKVIHKIANLELQQLIANYVAEHLFYLLIYISEKYLLLIIICLIYIK